MNKLIKNISAIALAAGIVALPGAANAATLTTTSTATLTVTDKCSITGADVDLGTYSVNQKWSDVAAALGSANTASVYTAGSKGAQYAKWGSITCATGTAYTLKINGKGDLGQLKLTIGGKTAQSSIWVKKVGVNTIADGSAAVPGAGAQVSGTGSVAGTGTGAAQDVLGNVVLNFANSTAVPADALTTAGTYTDTLSYTLTF